MEWSDLKHGSHDKGSHSPEQLEVTAGEYGRGDTGQCWDMPGVTGLSG